jgi:hypothetical protein
MEERAPDWSASYHRYSASKDALVVLRAFDLPSHDDVRVRADSILAALSDRRMPCGGAWRAGD